MFKGFTMFEKFTDRARRVVVLAQEEARLLRHDYIGTEHLLLGLIHEGDSVAARALESLEVTLDAVRGEIEEIMGASSSVPQGHIPFTPRAKKVLELSLREARSLGSDYIGPEHILLGLLREREGVGVQVLVRLGIDLNRVRQRVIQLMRAEGGGGPEGGADSESRPALARSRGPLEVLRRLDGIESRLHGIESWLLELELSVRTTMGRSDLPETLAAADSSALSDEIERLRRLLREHGIEPEGGAA